MNTEKPTTLVEAYRFVNERYIFNETNYPTLVILTNKDDRINFALKHSLLHMQKSLAKITRLYENTHPAGNKIVTLRFSDQHGTNFESDRHAFTKQVVNSLKVAEIVGITEEQFASIRPVHGISEFDEVLAEAMGILARECESADHGGKIEREEMIRAMSFTWARLLPFELLHRPEFLKYIPEVMKSKEPAM